VEEDGAEEGEGEAPVEDDFLKWFLGMT